MEIAADIFKGTITVLSVLSVIYLFVWVATGGR